MSDQSLPVFIVDDDEAVRDSIQALLDSAGLETIAFDAAEPFLEQHDSTVAGCLALDVHLPGLSGIDVLARLKEAGTDRLMTIVITGEGDIETAVVAMKLGAADFIEKPFDDDVFIERVQTLLQIMTRHDIIKV